MRRNRTNPADRTARLVRLIVIGSMFVAAIVIGALAPGAEAQTEPGEAAIVVAQ